MNIQRFYDVSQAGDAVALKARLEGFAADFGFEKYMGCMVYEPGAPRGGVDFVSLGNVPQEFTGSTNVDNAMRDPVLKAMRRLSVPFIYDRKTYEDANAGDLWEEQAVYGYKTGIAVALHLPGNKHFLLGMDRVRALPAKPERLTQLLAGLQLLAVHAQSAGERLLLQPQQAQPAEGVAVTPREREILLWTMEGKSQWAVGQILGISENSVKFHLKNILRKLNSSSKHQAVLKAISLGLIARR